MRWGIGIVLLSVVVGGLVGLGAWAPSEAGAETEAGPAYAPVEYTPAPPPRGLPPNRFRIQRVKRIRANGRAIVFVRVFAPGKVFVWGRGVRTVARGTARPRVVRVPVKPKVRLRRWLRRHGKGRIRVKIAFRPHGGVAREPRERPILLRKRRR